MSSVGVKEQVNRICRLARSFKEIKALCNTASIEAMEINNGMQSARFTADQESIVLLDFEEVDRLKKENEEMKLLLGDYHRGVELLMEAYRKRTISEAENKNVVTAGECFDPKLLETIVEQSNRISEMHDLMKKTATIDDNAENLINEHIAYLRKENTVLRELYEISTQFGSAETQICAKKLTTEDKTCQTDGVEHSDSDTNSDDDDVITVISLKLDESDDDDDHDDDDDDERKEILKSPDHDNVTSDENNIGSNQAKDI